MLDIEKTLLAHRYLYYVKCTPVLSDYAYDKLEREALLKVDEASPLHLPGSDMESSYSEDIKRLANKMYGNNNSRK